MAKAATRPEILFKGLAQLRPCGSFGHFGQGLGELMFGIVKIAELIDEEILKVIKGNHGNSPLRDLCLRGCRCSPTQWQDLQGACPGGRWTEERGRGRE